MKWLTLHTESSASSNRLGPIETQTGKWRPRLSYCNNKEVYIDLHFTSWTNILRMHKCLSWLKLEQRLLASLTLIFRSICVSNKPNCLYKLINYTSNRHNYSTRQVVMERFTVPMPKSNAIQKTVMYRAMSIWNALPHTIIDIKVRIHFEKQLKIHVNNSHSFIWTCQFI